MKNILFSIVCSICTLLMSCDDREKKSSTGNTAEQNEEVTGDYFNWEAANVYFLLTDRFNNGDPSNDVNFDRTREAGKLRGFEGGDLKGVTNKIREGYFNELGINAIWMTPVVEQIHGGTDEGTGFTYAYHGYWAKDWTAIDPNFGTADDLRELVEVAHENGIRILLDAVINHTGPATEKDPVWPDSWVRTGPQCQYNSYESTISCTLVKNLPDILTDSNDEIDLPPQLVEKWQAEGRYDQELKELDAFFESTSYPRAPRFYIMKWLADYILEFGIDGYRVDTVKHTEEFVWQEFKDVCDNAFQTFKAENPGKSLDDTPFFLVGEVYGYGISGGQYYNFGDKQVNYFDDAFNSLINFDFKWNAKENSYEEVFSSYSDKLESELQGFGVLNYLSSHDDGQPYDPERTQSEKAANYLLLAPGAAQVYYGDESSRLLVVEDAVGDANLRSNMNWEEPGVKTTHLTHWKKLGKFRNDHPAIGAGLHQMITSEPYVFYRSIAHSGLNDQVVIGLDLSAGEKTVDVRTIFQDGTTVRDAYSGKTATVTSGKASFDTEYSVLLIERQEL